MLLDLYSMAEDHRIVRWNSKKGIKLAEYSAFGTGACKNSFAVCERLNKIIGIAARHNQKNYLRILDMKRGKSVYIKAGKTTLQFVTFARKKGYIYTLNVFNQLGVWYLNSQRKIQALSLFGGSCVYTMGINPRDESLFLAGGSDSLQILMKDKSVVSVNISNGESTFNAIWMDRRNERVYLARENNMITVLRGRRVLSRHSNSTNSQNSSRATFSSKSDSSSEQKSSFLKYLAGNQPKKSLLFQNYGRGSNAVQKGKTSWRTSENRENKARSFRTRNKRMSHAVQINKRTSFALPGLGALRKPKSSERQMLQCGNGKLSAILASPFKDNQRSLKKICSSAEEKIKFQKLRNLCSQNLKLKTLASVNSDNSCVFNIHKHSLASRDLEDFTNTFMPKTQTLESIQDFSTQIKNQNISGHRLSNTLGTISFEKPSILKNQVTQENLANKSRESPNLQKNRHSLMAIKILPVNNNNNNNQKESQEESSEISNEEDKEESEPWHQVNNIFDNESSGQNNKLGLNFGNLHFIKETDYENSQYSNSVSSPSIDIEKRQSMNSCLLCPKTTIKRSSFNPKSNDLQNPLLLNPNAILQESKGFQGPGNLMTRPKLTVNSMNFNDNTLSSNEHNKNLIEQNDLLSVGRSSFHNVRTFSFEEKHFHNGGTKRKSQFKNEIDTDASEKSVDTDLELELEQ